MMLVVRGMAWIFAKGVLRTAFVVEDFVDNAFFEKGLEGTINRNSVKTILKAGLDVAMRKSKSLRKKDI